MNFVRGSLLALSIILCSPAHAKLPDPPKVKLSIINAEGQRQEVDWERKVVWDWAPAMDDPGAKLPKLRVEVTLPAEYSAVQAAKARAAANQKIAIETANVIETVPLMRKNPQSGRSEEVTLFFSASVKEPALLIHDSCVKNITYLREAKAA